MVELGLNTTGAGSLRSLPLKIASVKDGDLTKHTDQTAVDGMGLTLRSLWPKLDSNSNNLNAN